MKLSRLAPTLAEFKKLAKKGNLIPVSVDVIADRLTPVSLLAADWKKSPHCYLLESVEGGETLGRYSIVAFDPKIILEEKHGQTKISAFPHEVQKQVTGTALEFLQKEFRGNKAVAMAGLPRFFGGAVGYCSYETVHQFERLPLTTKDKLRWPSSVFFITDDMFIFDNTQQLLKVVSCAHIKNKNDVAHAYARAKRRIERNVSRLKKIHFKPAQDRLPAYPVKSSPFHTNIHKADYKKMVEQAKEFIRKGDIIQVVLSRTTYKQTKAQPLDLYRALRVVNPSPYMYLFKMKGRVIIGSSPESLVRLEDGVAMTRPIAGTRHRGKTPKEDVRLEKELMVDPKERSEHVMLVDLGRNDLGRVCQYGSVHIPTFMTVERYSHVMHIVSEVVGRLRRGKTGFDLLRAVFPAGTLSGAPKIRAMEIIDQLESDQRGPYGGAIGYLAYSGNMDMAITIRTLLWDKGVVSVQTGAGLVADSNPDLEFMETENKAAGMKSTISLAENRDMFLESI